MEINKELLETLLVEAKENPRLRQNFDLYKRQNKMFRFCKTFCSEFSIVNTKQNVHFTTKKIEAAYSAASSIFALNLRNMSIVG